MKQEINQLKKELRLAIKPEKAQILGRFFKTGVGQYGEGDKFLGVMVPEQRLIANKHINLELTAVAELLKSEWHEERLTAVLILVCKFAKAEEKEKKIIFDFYLKNKAGINNWDLVDLSADKIVGYWLCFHKNDKLIQELVNSKRLWDRRIAVLASYYFIRQGDAQLTFSLAEQLLKDKEDLMHKAVGWMLREVGKRISEKKLEEFLVKNVQKMPRTMLRYAIERLPEEKRQGYLKNKL